ncbi:IclR family transcriptional regulator [Williamsia limnetica]|uniref:IclR family transcriptional regulator n=1 Tax=Williamsia limnetica TaxID=882452 RepID=A0A318R8G1_WILLI|nr:IclR family transcriptional regulator [Williamsia limnetica]PYE11843.1 IclR family transcriptional regulator [Williamsia limnetica]
MPRDGKMSQLEKSALLLASFPGGTPLTLAQACTRTGLPRSTTHRLLVELSALGWITRTGNRFELGMTLFELGERVSVKHRLRSAAMPFMQDLFAVTEQTVHLAVRDNYDVVYIEKLHGHSALSLPSHIGGRLPLTCTAVGKALLAYETAAVRTDVLSRPMRRYTTNSITTETQLARELDEARARGVAIEREEAAIGGCCLAAAVLRGGEPVAALSVSVPAEQFRPELLAPAVRTAALALGRVLSRPSTTTTPGHLEKHPPHLL